MGLKRLNPKTLVVLGIALLIAGCVPVRSVHPLFTEKDLVFEPALLGTWALEDATLEFRQSERNAYDLTYTQEVSAKLEAHLLRLGEFLFLDISLGQRAPEALFPRPHPAYLVHMFPVHTFWRIRIEGDELHLEDLDDGWVNRMIREGIVEIHHARLGEYDIVLTAPTEELQEFLLTHAKSPEAFQALRRWQRRR